MKPIAIFQHDPLQRPGYLLEFFEERRMPARVLRACDGDDAPRFSRFFSGVVVLGSDANINDPAPWTERELRLATDASPATFPCSATASAAS